MFGVKDSFSAWNGYSVKLQASSIKRDIRFVVAAVTNVGAVIGVVIVGGEHEEDDARLILVEMFLQEQIFLIGAVAADAEIENLPIGMASLELVGKALFRIDVIPPDERIPEEQNARRIFQVRLIEI